MIKRFFPVIHAVDVNQMSTNVDIALTAGADGVFFINHGDCDQALFERTVTWYSKFRSEDFLIGINFLSSDNFIDLERAAALGCGAVWSDNAYVEDSKKLLNFAKLQLQIRPHIDFFGGIHFKYQPKSTLTISESIKKALVYVDYPMLSGPATGQAADLDFIKEAFDAAQGWPLSIASGITIDNVEDYLPFIDNFLVASSITDSKEIFNQAAVVALKEKIKRWNQ